MSTLIMHIDMDAFFASVEQQVNPQLRGKPVIIGGRNNKYHSIICAASYEAKALGIKNAMPSWKALKICPHAIFVPADTAKYVYTSNEIFKILKKYTPQIEKFSVDEFFLDVAGCEKLFGPPQEMGRSIKREIKRRFGINCTVGVAPTKITAKLAAKMHKPDGLSVMSKREVLEKLKNLPVERICGIGKRLKQRFNILGIRTCGELSQYPTELLKSHFGVMGVWLKAACLVEDVCDIKLYAKEAIPPKSVGHSQTLRKTTTDQNFIKEWVYLLSEMVAARLRRKKLQGKTVYFYVSDGFDRGLAKRKTFSTHTYDGHEIYRRCCEIMASFDLPYICARVLGVSVSSLSKSNDFYLFEEDIKREQLLKYIDQINNRFGEWTIYPAAFKCAKY